MQESIFGLSKTSVAILDTYKDTQEAVDMCFMESGDLLAFIEAAAARLDLSLSDEDKSALNRGALTDDMFFNALSFVPNHIDDNASLDGDMFETYGAEYEYVKSIYSVSPHRVWTYRAFYDENQRGRIKFTNEMYTDHCLGYLIANEDSPTASTNAFISAPF